MSSSPPDNPDARPVALTRAQWDVYLALHDYASLHYGGSCDEGGLKPRLYPLIVGPTGAGKSMLVEKVARELGAAYFRITYGEWIPLGARDPASATLVRLGRLLAKNPRVVVHVDELDKWITGDREWGRSISTDLWNLLDAKLPWEQIALVEMMSMVDKELQSPEKPAEPTSEEAPELPSLSRRTEHMWIVGSGTWQSVFERRKTRAIGFQPGAAPAGRQDTAQIIEAIRTSKILPTELTARFATDLLVMTYPTREETEHLLEVTGLNALAWDLGVGLSPDDVDYEVAGMRALESLKTRLLLEIVRRHRYEAPEELIDDLEPGGEPPAP